jgi:hypothetical protein
LEGLDGDLVIGLGGELVDNIFDLIDDTLKRSICICRLDFQTSIGTMTVVDMVFKL